MIDRFKNRWNWTMLSLNWALPWSEELIDRYKDDWEWAWLSSNIYLPWCEEWMTRFRDLCFWGSGECDEDGFLIDGTGLSCNMGISWNEALMLRFPGYFNLDAFIFSRFDCGNTEWTTSLLERFAERWDWSRLSYTDNVYDRVIKPYSDDALIDEVMRRISLKRVQGASGGEAEEHLT